MKNYSNCFVVFTILVMFLLLASQGILAAGLTINVGNVIAEAGDAVIIPIKFEDIPYVGINNCDFRINQLSATPESDEPTDTGQIELELSQNTTTTTNTINPTFTLSNIGTSSISLSDLKIRYYYTIDGGQTQNFWCDNGAIVSPSYSNITSSVEGTFTEMSSSTSDADYYLEIGFSGNTLAAGATAEIQTRFVKDDWSNYDQSNDFSFNNAENVTVYINGQLVWGNVPEGGTIGVPTAPELNSVEAGVGSVTLDWNSVTDADGYIIKYGTVSANYTQEIDVASSTAYTVSNLLNTTYYFVVVAYNEAGNSDNSNELSATPQDDNESTEFTIDIGIATASPGDTVTIPIKLVNVPSAGINNCDFKVGFDSNVLEVVDVSTGDIIPRPTLDFYSYINTEEEYVSFLFADEEQQGNNLIYDDGVFANIEFRVLAGAPAGLTEIIVSSVGAFADYDLNVFEVETETGGITVSN